MTPTIADVLNVRLGYRADGRSAFSAAVRARREVSLVTRDFSSDGAHIRPALAGAPALLSSGGGSGSSAPVTGRASSRASGRTGT